VPTWIGRTPVAFIMPVITGSTPEAVILRKAREPRPIDVSFGAEISGITAFGGAFTMVLRSEAFEGNRRGKLYGP
jgi:hypothetical protein